MKKMMYFKQFLCFLVSLLCFSFLLSGAYAQEVYEQKTFTFTSQEELETIISTNTEYVDFSFEIENTQDEIQEFNIFVIGDEKWNIGISNSNFRIQPFGKRTITFRASTPEELGYKKIVDSQGLSKFEIDDEYFGQFDFLIRADSLSSEDDLEVIYGLDVYAPTNLPIDFKLSPSSLFVTPNDPISVRVSAFNLDEELGVNTQVIAHLFMGDEDLEIGTQEITFSNQRDIVDVQFDVSSSISPGIYDLLIEVKVDQGEGQRKSWELNENVEVLEYRNLQATYDKKYSFWAFRDVIAVENLGNVDSIFEHRAELSWYERLFLSTQMNTETVNSEHVFTSEVKAGESQTFEISFRYGIVLLIIVVIVIIIGIRVYQLYKNPLEIDLKIESVKKVKHEGVKSFKIKLGFENIRREEISTLRVIFRMPSYLHVKENSFSLTPPTKVLKGSSKYKLIWEFKRFEKGDARIVGFDLTNSKGILGDIHFEDIEFEVITKNKTSKYYSKVKTIYG